MTGFYNKQGQVKARFQTYPYLIGQSQKYGKYAGQALKLMQAVLIFASKRPFLVPLARVLTKSSASSIEIPIKMLIFAIAYTSFCCFKCKRSSVAMLSNPQYQTHCRAQFGITIGSAHSRDRPAGGQPFRDVAARTAGAEHPTTVFVGCGACKIVFLKVQSDV